MSLTLRRWATLAIAIALSGCTETFVGFHTEFSSNVAAIQFSPPNHNNVRLVVAKNVMDQKWRPRLDRAILKIDGYLPIEAGGAFENNDSYNATIELPPDMVKDLVKRGTTTHGTLFYPVDLPVRSFTGFEFYERTTYHMGVSMRPQMSGPMTRLAEKIGSFLRGLYAAR